MPSVNMLLLNGRQVRSLLTYDMVYSTVEQVFRWAGGEELLLSTGNALWLDPRHDNMLNSMAAAIPRIQTAGVKWFNMFTVQQPGMPKMFGHVIVLNHMENGVPFALVEGTSITNMRTAAGHGTVAAKWLARKNSKTLALIGCGSQGRFALQGLVRHFPLRQIRLYSAHRASMAAFERDMRGQGIDLEYIPCASGREAARDADIVVTATSAKQALVRMEDLSPGTTVIGLYSFNDLDPEIASGSDKWILGCRQTDTHSILHHPMLQARGVVLPPERVYGDMGEVICGHKTGRDHDRQIIVYTHMGMAAFDVALAKAVYNQAVTRKIGQYFSLE